MEKEKKFVLSSSLRIPDPSLLVIKLVDSTISADLFKSLRDGVIKVLHSLCQQIWKTQQWPQDWKRSILMPIPKRDSTKECANHETSTLISHASKAMLKILHAVLEHCANQELPDVQAVFRKGRGTRGQIGNICWIIEEAREFQKNIYLFSSTTLVFNCVDHDKLWKDLREMGIPDFPTCLLRNLYAGQEGTVRTLYGTTNWFKIQKRVRQGCMLSPCLFNLYAEYIMRNARLDVLQAGIKIGGRNINNFRYVDDTSVLAEKEEELKRLVMRVKEESERTG